VNHLHLRCRQERGLVPLSGTLDRAVPRRLARQGEAPIGADSKARTSRAMPCKSRQREGRRERGSVRSVREGAIPRAHSHGSLGQGPMELDSESVESTSIRRKPSPFAGLRWKRIFGQVTCDGEESPAPSARWIGDPGAREMFEKGRSPSQASPLLGRSRPTPLVTRREPPNV